MTPESPWIERALIALWMALGVAGESDVVVLLSFGFAVWCEWNFAAAIDAARRGRS